MRNAYIYADLCRNTPNQWITRNPRSRMRFQWATRGWIAGGGGSIYTFHMERAYGATTETANCI